MHTITLDGQEYILKCDVNVIEQIEDKYGDVRKAFEKVGEIADTKELAAMMINEQFYFARSPERVTPQWVGSRINDTAAFAGIVREILAALNECIAPKNA